jgi:hypothetical protein
MSEEPEVPIGDPRVRVTTGEAANEKAGVAGYEVRPVVALREGELACEFCGYNRFRRSRTRFRDLMELLMMRYPVRCMRCGQRQYFELTFALLAHAPKAQVERVAEGTDTWQNWTQATGEAPDQPTPARPMTTAVGPRAQRLTQQPARPPRTTAPPVAPAVRTRPRSRDDNGIW